MAKMKFRIKRRTKKNNSSVEVDSNIENYDQDIVTEDRVIENLSEGLDLEQDTTEEVIQNKQKSRKKKRKMRLRNPLVKIIKKL